MGYSKGASIDDFHGVYIPGFTSGGYDLACVVCKNTGKKTLATSSSY